MYELVVFENCPFCHRCELVLLEKRAAFRMKLIERSKKQEAMHLLSPYLRVPVLWHDGQPVYESSIINEYLDEVIPSPRLLPEDAGRKALARFWTDFCNARFMPAYFNLLKERDPGRRGPLSAALLDHLNVIETVALANVRDTEPYWMGGEVTLVDYAFYPFFERFVSVETYRGITIPADHQRLRLWINHMNRREAVTRTARSRDYYVEYFGRIYADQ